MTDIQISLVEVLERLFSSRKKPRVFEYSVILVGSFISCFMFSNMLRELFPSWSMLKSPISTKPFLSRAIFAKELLRDFKKLASFTFGGLYVAATKSGLHFGLLISNHNNSLYLLLVHS